VAQVEPIADYQAFAIAFRTGPDLHTIEEMETRRALLTYADERRDGAGPWIDIGGEG
jgi:hypothetical protein